MPTIQVRNVPDHLYRTLTEQAKRERRSLAQQVVATLERGLASASDPRARRRALLEEVRLHGPISSKLDPVVIVREDRSR